MADDDRPVLIGAGMLTLREAGEIARSPQDLMADAARHALADAGGHIDAKAIDSIIAIRTFADSAPQFASPFGGARNYPRAVARRIGAEPGFTAYPAVGGNSPQAMVTLLAERIARGKSKVALLVGGEAIRSMQLLVRSGAQADWNEEDPPPDLSPGDARPGMTPLEIRHGIASPADVYPLFESALAARYDRDMEAQRDHIAQLFARFSKIAAAHPQAALPVERAAPAIRDPGPDNRMIAWPYTKYMNANMFVDQAAAVLLTSVGVARAAGIGPDAMVHLAGAADLDEKWYLGERVAYDSSPAIRLGAEAALGRARIGVDDLDFIDLYSCFPSAVEVAADALGLGHDDPRGLTVTGGLPFFGGAGNAYSLFAIAEIFARLRAKGRGHGLVTANGWYLTKHSFGVYAAGPPRGDFMRGEDGPLQARIDAMPSPPRDESPEGACTVEAATVSFSRNGPERAIVIGKLDTGARFFANGLPGDAALHDALMGPRPVGMKLIVASEKGKGVVRLP